MYKEKSPLEKATAALRMMRGGATDSDISRVANMYGVDKTKLELLLKGGVEK